MMTNGQFKKIHRRFCVALAVGMAAFSAATAAPPNTPISEQQEVYKQVEVHAHELTDDYFAKDAQRWRDYFQAFRSDAVLRPFVAKLLTFPQKARVAAELGGNGTHDRFRELFRTMVFDDQETIKMMKESLQGVNRFLYDDVDAVIAQRLGLQLPPRPYVPDANIAAPWERRFGRVIDTAVSAAQRDIARLAANVAAGNLIGDGIRDASIRADIWGVKPGSWQDAVAKFALDLAVDAAVDAATDPTNKIVVSLKKELALSEAAVLDGPDGYLAQLKRIVEAHKQLQTDLIDSKR